MNPRTAIQKGIDALTPPRNNEEDQARRALTKLLHDTSSAPTLAAELIRVLQAEDSNKHALQAEPDELTADPYHHRRFHFSFGDTNDGPLGMCAEVDANTRAEAIQILAAALPAEHGIIESGSDGLRYIRAYFNADHIKPTDIDEETPIGT